MLENIRKYTGLFIVVLVLIFVGLIFIQSNSSGRGPGSGPVLAKTNHKTYSLEDLRDGERHIRLAQRLSAESNRIGNPSTRFGTEAAFDILSYLGTLQAANSSETKDQVNFLVHRTSFERAKKEFGLDASQDEIELYQREKIFTNREGIFDDKAYKDFTEKGLKGLSVTINDVNDFIGDVIAFKALSNLLGTGVIADEKAAQESFIAQTQEITLSTCSLDLESFIEKVEVTDEEVKTYWQEHRGRYLSEAKRRLTYIVATPDFEKALATKKEEMATKAKTPAEEAENAEKTAEEIAAADKAKMEAMVLTPQERKKVVDELSLIIEENIWIILQNEIENGADKVDLERLAKKEGYEIKTTELLPISELPTDLRGSVRGSRKTVQQELEAASITSGNLMDSLGEILGIGQENWLLFRVDEAEEPSEKTFEEAKDTARNDFIQEKGEEALATAIESAREEVAKAISEGAAIKEAAEAQGLKVTSQLGLSAFGTVPGEPNARDLFRLASQTKSGEVSKAEVMLPLKDRGLFVYVEEREFVESDQNKSGLQQAGANQTQDLQTILLQHWFSAEYQKADVEFVKTKS